MAGTIVSDVLQDGAGNSTSSTQCIKGSARAWVNFVGQTGVVNTAYNVSSITRNGTGDYTANFTTTMPNANYVVAGSAVGSSNTSYLGNIASQGTATSTSSCRFVFQYAATTYDQNPIGVVFFGY